MVIRYLDPYGYGALRMVLERLFRESIQTPGS